MGTFVISLLVFGAAFAALAIGALWGRPLASGGCGDCKLRTLVKQGGCDADRP